MLQLLGEPPLWGCILLVCEETPSPLCSIRSQSSFIVTFFLASFHKGHELTRAWIKPLKISTSIGSFSILASAMPNDALIWGLMTDLNLGTPIPSWIFWKDFSSLSTVASPPRFDSDVYEPFYSFDISSHNFCRPLSTSCIRRHNPRKAASQHIDHYAHQLVWLFSLQGVNGGYCNA